MDAAVIVSIVSVAAGCTIMLLLGLRALPLVRPSPTTRKPPHSPLSGHATRRRPPQWTPRRCR